MHPLFNTLDSQTIVGCFIQSVYQSSRAKQKMWQSPRMDPAWIQLPSAPESCIGMLASAILIKLVGRVKIVGILCATKLR